MTGLPHLADDDLAGLGITPAEAADSVERALRAQVAGTLWSAPKTGVLPGDGRYAMATLAIGDDPPVAVLKAVLVNPRNPGRGLDAINGAILVLDAETGLPRATLGANWITAVRTAALSAVAARRLADPAAETIAFIGCGVQARSHLDAFAALFPLRRVLAVGRGRANIDRLCALAADKGLEAKAAATPREALAEADIVVSSVTLDHQLEPFVDARWLKPGAFAAVTDVARPWLPEGLAAFDTVVIDDLAQEAAMPERMVDPDLVTDDLSGLVTRGGAGFAPDRRAAFVFRGMAVGDFALAALALSRAGA